MTVAGSETDDYLKLLHMQGVTLLSGCHIEYLLEFDYWSSKSTLEKGNDPGMTERR